MVAPTGRGGPGRGQGRSRTSLRTLADSIGKEIAAHAKMFGPEPVDIVVEGLAIERCACGALSHRGYRIVAHRHEALPEPDAQGNLYPIVGSREVPGQPARHNGKCNG